MTELRWIDPELSALPDAEPVVLRLIRFAVSGEVPEEPMTLGPAVAARLVRGRVTSLLLSAIDAGVFDVGPRTLESLPGASELAAAAIRLQDLCRRLTGMLEVAGIESIVLKGLATSQLDYRSPGLRDTGDVDLLIRTESFDEAVALLLASGCHDRHLVGLDPDLLKGLTLYHDDGTEIDLHQRLFLPVPRSEVDLFWSKVRLPNGIGFGLDADLRFVHAAGHLMSTAGARRLSSLVDMAVMLGEPAGSWQGGCGLDWDRVRAMSYQFAYDQAVQRSVEIEHALSGRSGSVEAIAPFRRLDPVRLGTVRVRRNVIVEYAAIVAGLPGWGARLRYLRRWLVPGPEVRRAHGGSWWSYYASLPRRAR